jgi:hypothetical protein
VLQALSGVHVVAGQEGMPLDADEQVEGFNLSFAAERKVASNQPHLLIKSIKRHPSHM